AILGNERLAQRVAPAALGLDAHALVGDALALTDRQRATIDLRPVEGVLPDGEQRRRNGPGVLAGEVPGVELHFGVQRRQAGGEELAGVGPEVPSGEALALGDAVISAAQVLA